MQGFGAVNALELDLVAPPFQLQRDQPCIVRRILYDQHSEQILHPSLSLNVG